MNKKRMATLAAAGITTVGLVGGTLAWFTSWDNVTNVFNTGDLTDTNDNGVEIWEKFTSPEYITPGSITDKLVHVQNTTNYDSFIRVKFEKQWINDDTNGEVDTSLNIDKIGLHFTDNVVKYKGKTADNKDYYVYVNDENLKVFGDDLRGKWIAHTDGYYYYVGRVPGESFTHTLLKSVEFVSNPDIKSEDDNKYRNKKMNVKVYADSIQADNDAYKSLGLKEATKDENGKITAENDQRILDLLAKYSKDNINLDSKDNVTINTNKQTNLGTIETTQSEYNYQQPSGN